LTSMTARISPAAVLGLGSEPRASRCDPQITRLSFSSNLARDAAWIVRPYSAIVCVGVVKLA
jgi:hypothetical protein